MTLRRYEYKVLKPFTIFRSKDAKKYSYRDNLAYTAKTVKKFKESEFRKKNSYFDYEVGDILQSSITFRLLNAEYIELVKMNKRIP